MSSATRKLSPAGTGPVEPPVEPPSPRPARRRNSRSAPLHEVVIARQSAKSLESGEIDGIKRVPQPKALREQVRRRCALLAGRIEQTALPRKNELERLARTLLTEMELPECFVGWTMVMLASAFWQPNIAATPYDRRLLLLPGNLPHESTCHAASEDCGAGVSDASRRAAEPPAEHLRTDGANGSAAAHKSASRQIPSCSACGAAWLRARAEKLGYRVLWVEESPAVLAALAGAEIDAVMGVASLDLLEKAVDQIPQFDLPCMAIPLLDEAAVVPFDTDWVRRMIELPHAPADRSAPNYRHLMRAARRMFEPEELELLAPRIRPGPRLAELNGQGAALLEPLAGTEAIAYDFLTRGGKHSRPFITLAVYDAMTGGGCTLSNGHRRVAELPLAVKRAAVSIETFHKASLVHDDIEDDDQFRYGTATLHRALGVSTAINVGDYLIGLGYRLVSRESVALGADTVSDIMDRLADAHMKLTEGQGAELLWRDSRRKRLSAAEALEIYALKTAPAFEAALITGLRLAGPSEAYLKPIGEFARHLGTAFQILNDLADWTADNHNKLVAAGDVLGGRPTVLWALALEGLPEPSRSRLETLAASSPVSEPLVREIRALYQAADVFDKAERLVREYDKRARAVAESVRPGELCRLLHYLIEKVLRTRC